MRKDQKVFYLIAIIVFILIAMGTFVYLRSSYLYKYDVRKDYVYDFSNTESRQYKLILKNHTIKIPKLSKDWNTAILEIKVKSGLLGWILAPEIRITGKGHKLIQCFENNCNGLRYIDLSSVLTGDEQLELVCSNLKLYNQDVMLYLFNNPDIKNSKVLVLSPHPDDAEIAAYGLYSKANDSSTYIVTITAGEAGAKTYDELYKDDFTHYTKKGEIRVWNSIVIPMLGGILPGHALNLGYFDGMLSDMYKNPEEDIASRSLHISDINHFRKMNYPNTLIDSNGVSSWTGLVDDLSKILLTIQPDIIVSPYPANSNHPDHKLTTVALFDAIIKTGMKNGEVYLYANDNIPGGNFYPYGYIYSSIPLPPRFKEPLYFNSIYCQPLSFNEQNDKLLALEAMNDLRPDTEWRSSKGSIRQAARTTFKNVFGLDRSYYRRAVRSNELFFVLDVKKLYDNDILRKVQGLK